VQEGGQGGRGWSWPRLSTQPQGLPDETQPLRSWLQVQREQLCPYRGYYFVRTEGTAVSIPRVQLCPYSGYSCALTEWSCARTAGTAV